jgi:hypothetical protein
MFSRTASGSSLASERYSNEGRLAGDQAGIDGGKRGKWSSRLPYRDVPDELISTIAPHVGPIEPVSCCSRRPTGSFMNARATPAPAWQRMKWPAHFKQLRRSLWAPGVSTKAHARCLPMKPPPHPLRCVGGRHSTPQQSDQGALWVTCNPGRDGRLRRRDRGIVQRDAVDPRHDGLGLGKVGCVDRQVGRRGQGREVQRNGDLVLQDGRIGASRAVGNGETKRPCSPHHHARAQWRGEGANFRVACGMRSSQNAAP